MKLNKLFFSIVFFTLITQTSFAQDESSTAGIRASLNLTNMYVEDVDDENLKVGFAAGVYYRSQLSELISIQPEINYSLKGSQLTYDNFIASGEYRFNLSYIEVPVLANIHLGESLYVSAGPYIAALIGVKVKNVDSDGSTDSVTQLDRDDFNTLDYGVAGGVGFDFTGGTLGVRYNYGLVDVQTDDNDNFTSGKNSAIQFYVGFNF